MDTDQAVIVDRLREALRNFPTGVTVVAAEVDGQLVGLTVSAFTSVSLDPPVVLFCVNAAAHSHERLLAATSVGISILSGDQDEIALAFATAGGDKFARSPWHPGSRGVPLIDGAAAHLQGAVIDTHSIGTHTVFIIGIDAVDSQSADPLVYFQRRFVHGQRLAD